MFTNPLSTKTDGTTTVTALELNTLGTYIERSLDGVNGSGAGATPYTLAHILILAGAGLQINTVLSCGAASTATFDGSTLIANLVINGATKVVNMTSRSETRNLSLDATTVSGWDIDSSTGSWINSTASAPIPIRIDRLPHNNTITGVTIRYRGAAGHGALPSPRPGFTVYRVDNSNTATALAAAAVDPSVDVAAYEVAHNIPSPSINHLIDLTQYRYFIRFTGEGVTDFVSGAILIQAQVTCTCTEYPEF